MTAPRLCLKRPLCTEIEDHAGPCVEIPRTPIARPAWDTQTPDPIGWRQTKAAKP